MSTAHEPLDRLETNSSSGGPWIHSAAFDSAFFILAPLVGTVFLLLAPHGPSLPAMVLGALLGIPHYLSTFVFYLWDENRPYHRSRWIAFFAGPVIITLAYAALIKLKAWLVIGSVIYIWNAYHVARQNCGIASIYRHRAGVSDNTQKARTNAAILAVSMALTFWHVIDHPQVPQLLSALHASAVDILRYTLAGVAVYAVVRLAAAVVERVRTGRTPTVGEACFLATSLLMFNPYLWVRHSSVATLGMLLGHFIQYLGLVWLVQHRRFVRQESLGSMMQRGLAKLSTNLGLLLGVCVVTGGAFFVTQYLGQTNRRVFNYSESFLLLLALMHFYLDGLFWAFKDPQVRKTLGPLVMGRAPARPVGHTP